MHIALAHENAEQIAVLHTLLSEVPGPKIIWSAADEQSLLQHYMENTPDLLLLSVGFSDGNCAALVERLSRGGARCGILLISHSVDADAGIVFQAMGKGAMDVTTMPRSESGDFATQKSELIAKVKSVALLLGHVWTRAPAPPHAPLEAADGGLPLVVLGASTGGPAALAEILKYFPVDFPAAVVVIQHVDEHFAVNFANWLSKQTSLNTHIVEHEVRPQAGHVYVAGTGNHMVLNKDGFLCYREQAENLSYRPSVDVFFHSVVQNWPGTVIAVLLTGMGSDGADGLLALRRAGCLTIAQEKSSCAVYGMPRAARELGAATMSLKPDDIAATIVGRVLSRSSQVKSA